MSEKRWAKQRRMMRLDFNCLPVRPPIVWTTVALLAADHWPSAEWGWYIVIVLSWLLWLVEAVYSQRVDIFENFRKMKESEGL